LSELQEERKEEKMSRLLDLGHKIVAGGLMSASAFGLATLGYGVYRIKVVRPRELAERAAAAEATTGAVPIPPPGDVETNNKAPLK
jgi:hypothetical protein